MIDAWVATMLAMFPELRTVNPVATLTLAAEIDPALRFEDTLHVPSVALVALKAGTLIWVAVIVCAVRPAPLKFVKLPVWQVIFETDALRPTTLLIAMVGAVTLCSTAELAAEKFVQAMLLMFAVPAAAEMLVAVRPAAETEEAVTLCTEAVEADILLSVAFVTDKAP